MNPTIVAIVVSFRFGSRNSCLIRLIRSRLMVALIVPPVCLWNRRSNLARETAILAIRGAVSINSRNRRIEVGRSHVHRGHVELEDLLQLGLAIDSHKQPIGTQFLNPLRDTFVQEAFGMMQLPAIIGLCEFRQFWRRYP